MIRAMTPMVVAEDTRSKPSPCWRARRQGRTGRFARPSPSRDGIAGIPGVLTETGFARDMTMTADFRFREALSVTRMCAGANASRKS